MDRLQKKKEKRNVNTFLQLNNKKNHVRNVSQIKKHFHTTYIPKVRKLQIRLAFLQKQSKKETLIHFLS